MVVSTIQEVIVVVVGVWEYQDGGPPPNLMDMCVCDQLQLQNWYWHKKSRNVVVLSF